MGDGFVAPGFHPTAPDASSSASRAPRVSSRASSVVGATSRQVADGGLKDDEGANDDTFPGTTLEEPCEPLKAEPDAPDLFDSCSEDAGRTSSTGLECQHGDFLPSASVNSLDSPAPLEAKVECTAGVSAPFNFSGLFKAEDTKEPPPASRGKEADGNCADPQPPPTAFRPSGLAGQSPEGAGTPSPPPGLGFNTRVGWTALVGVV